MDKRMKDVKVAKSTRSGKKYQASFKDGPTVHFGAAGMSDFTKNKDPERKKAYLARHKANENWADKESAGFWSRYLLWEKTSLQEAAKALRSMGLHVTLQA